MASLGASTASQTGTINVVTADSNGTLGVASTGGLMGLALNSDVMANTGNIAANSAAIGALQGQTATLFDLASANAQGVREANEGVAMALSMESPVLMPTDSFGIAGGFGYYNDRVAGSASFAARISDNAAFTGGVGIGFDEGEVGARAGFQVTW